jgi:hypothetical protein
MAGSYNHCVDDNGRLIPPGDLSEMLEYHDTGDVYEAIEEMYGMIWYLADADSERVEDARQNYREGLRISPGPWT